MTDQPNKTAAIKALCKAQAAMTKAVKDTDNPFFKTKYADLANVQDACLPALHANGFAVTSRLGRDESGGFVETVLLHESGEGYCCSIPLIVDKQNMQGLGSAITYARRYGLMCLSGVAPEDDDGNSAAANPPKHRAMPLDRDDGMLAAQEINTMKTITNIDELSSYWRVLKEADPQLAKRPDVIAAKDERKAVIGGKEAV